MWKFIKSATDESNYLKGHAKEICFIGRSNVGKSSLINALAKDGIARTSNTPGRTQLVNFFTDGPKMFVDLPGYGYAKMNKENRRKMNAMVMNYIKTRDELIKVIILVDGKVGPTDEDVEMMEYVKEVGKEFFVVMTKCDKPNQSELHKATEEVKWFTQDFIQVSASKGKNIDKLRKYIEGLF